MSARPAGAPDDAQLRAILGRTRVVACIGASANPERPSHFVSAYLQSRGIRVIPVNPGLAGSLLLGEPVPAGLADIPADERARIDMIDIFRRSEAVPGIVSEALELLPGLRTVWMQIGISHEEAAAGARLRGVDVVENRCPMVEFPRLLPA